MITGTDLRVDAGAVARYWAWDPGTGQWLCLGFNCEGRGLGSRAYANTLVRLASQPQGHTMRACANAAGLRC